MFLPAIATQGNVNPWSAHDVADIHLSLVTVKQLVGRGGSTLEPVHGDHFKQIWKRVPLLIKVVRGGLDADTENDEATEDATLRIFGPLGPPRARQLKLIQHAS